MSHSLDTMWPTSHPSPHHERQKGSADEPSSSKYSESLDELIHEALLEVQSENEYDLSSHCIAASLSRAPRFQLLQVYADEVIPTKEVLPTTQAISERAPQDRRSLRDLWYTTKGMLGLGSAGSDEKPSSTRSAVVLGTADENESTKATPKPTIDVIDAVIANRSGGGASSLGVPITVAPGADLGGGIGSALQGMSASARNEVRLDFFQGTTPVRTQEGLVMPQAPSRVPLTQTRSDGDSDTTPAKEASKPEGQPENRVSTQSEQGVDSKSNGDTGLAPGHHNLFEGEASSVGTRVDATRLAVIQRAFDAFTQLDTDKDYMIDIDQLERGLKLLEPNRQFTRPEIEEIFRTADTTRTGRLHFAEFYSICACLALLEYRFGLSGGETSLTPLQVKTALKQAGLSLADEQLEHMFRVRDHTGAQHTRRDKLSFPQILQIYLAAPRTEGELFLHSWYQAGRTTFLHHKQHFEASPLQDLIAGTAAGVALTLVGHPFDTVKVRMQTTRRFNSAGEVVRKTILREGPLALFKGMGSPMLTVPAINAIVFASYAQGRDFFARRHPENPELSLLEITAAGAYSGLLNSIIVCPVELVKTRLQIQYGEGTKVFAGPVDCIRHILKASGIKGLFRGMSATIYREVPGYAGQFFFYETFKRQLMRIGNRAEAELTSFDLLFAGGMAGMGSWLCSYPMDYVKSQIQSEPYNQKTKWRKHPYLFDGGFISCWKQTVREKGFRELWKGFGVCLMRAWPANAAGFLAYETTLSLVRNQNI